MAGYETAKLFGNGGSQAVRLPKSCRFEGDEVLARRLYKGVVVLVSKDEARNILRHALRSFSDDFMEDGRPPEYPSLREEL